MPRVNIGVLISGGGTNLQAIIDKIEDGHINGEIKVVISNKEDAYGLTRAKNHGIEALYINRKKFSSEEEYNEKIIEELKKRKVELVVLAGYLKILSESFIENYRGRIINIHPSLIPSFCGKGCYGEKVHQMALDRGVKITGVTVHFVDEGADTGPIILQRVVEVKMDDTVESLQKRTLEVEHEIFPEAIKLYCEGKLNIEGPKVIVKQE